MIDDDGEFSARIHVFSTTISLTIGSGTPVSSHDGDLRSTSEEFTDVATI